MRKMEVQRKRKTKLHKDILSFIVSIAIGLDLTNHLLGQFPGLCNQFVVKSQKKTAESASFKQERTSGVLLIGVMSADKYLKSRIEAALDTWMKHVPFNVRVEVFAESNGTFEFATRTRIEYLRNGVRVVELPGVSDRQYPPQKKSFSMLKFMHDVYVDKFDWFMRLDDDAYVDVGRLQRVLARVNSSKPVFMGHLALGLHREDFLNENESFCMGGPGIILSKRLLQKLAPKLKYCLTHLRTEHEDVELGRCVQHMTGQKCITSWEAAEIFFQDFRSQTGYIKNMKKIHFDVTATFHPNKNTSHQNKLHVVLLRKKFKKLISKIVKLEKERKLFEDFKRKGNSNNQTIWTTALGKTTFNYIGHVKAGTRPRFLQVQKNYARGFHKKSLREKKTIKTISSDVSYFSANPLESSDYVTKLSVKYLYGPRKVHPFLLNFKQRFPSNLQFFNEPKPLHVAKQQAGSQAAVVNFLVIIYKREKTFLRYLKNFEDTFLIKEEKVNLVVIYFSRRGKLQSKKVHHDRSNTSTKHFEFTSIQMQVTSLQKRHPNRTIKVINMKNVPYCKTTGLQRAKDEIRDENEIIFFCDVDMLFSSSVFLRHVRRNTVQGKRVYLLVTFSEFNPKIVYSDTRFRKSRFEYREIDGFWRYYGFGMLSIYKSDFMRTNGFDTKICGWGQEDVEMINSVLKAKLDVFNAVLPYQVHGYHNKYCDNSLPEMRLVACKVVRAIHYGPSSLLSNLYRKLDRRNQTLSFTRT